MMHTNEKIINQQTGDFIEIYQSPFRESLSDPAKDFRQGVFELHTTLQAYSAWAKSTHYHPKSQETFQVLEGELMMSYQGKELKLTPADAVVVVKPYEVHCFWNATDKPVRFKSLISPAGNIEKGIRATYLMANEGLMAKNNLPKNIFLLAVLGTYFDGYATSVPVWVQRTFLFLFAPIGKLFGYKRKIEKLLINHIYQSKEKNHVRK